MQRKTLSHVVFATVAAMTGGSAFGQTLVNNNLLFNGSLDNTVPANNSTSDPQPVNPAVGVLLTNPTPGGPQWTDFGLVTDGGPVVGNYGHWNLGNTFGSSARGTLLRGENAAVLPPGSDEHAVGGDWDALHFGGANTAGDYGFQQTIPVTPGKLYMLMGTANAVTGANTSPLLSLSDVNGSSDRAGATSSGGTNVGRRGMWQTRIAGAGVTSMTAKFGIRASAADGAVGVRFDGLRVAEFDVTPQTSFQNSSFESTSDLSLWGADNAAQSGDMYFRNYTGWAYMGGGMSHSVYQFEPDASVPTGAGPAAGTQSVKIDQFGRGSANSHLFQRVDAGGVGSTYDLSGWMRAFTGATAAGARIGLEIDDGDLDYTDADIVWSDFALADNLWAQYEATGAALVDNLGNGVVVWIEQGYTSTSSLSGGAFFDALQLDTVATASTIYWDTNGATAGAGGTSPGGAWDGLTQNFNNDATGGAGAGLTQYTSAIDTVVFSAAGEGTGSYNVTVSGAQKAGTVQIAQGDVTFNGTGSIATGAFDVASGANGTVGVPLTGGAVAKNGAGTLKLAAANTHTGGTTVNAGTLVVGHADALGTGGLTVNNATARAELGLTNATKAISVATVAVTGTGAFDITDNDLVIKNMTHNDVQALIVAGYNNGTWDGAGINSSAAATDANADTAIGYFDNAEVQMTSFSGVALTGPEIVVKYTYYGDADLTGVVDTDDFQLFLAGYQDPTGLPRTWFYGDFDYNGVVDTDDFQVFLYGYQNQGGPLSVGELADALASAEGISSSDRAFMEAAIAAVPEPASLGVLGLAGLGLLARRRRNVR